MDARVRNTWLTAAECAQRIGLTVRALRVYEQHGLITPRRTGKGWRLYGADEVARLSEVLILKSLGLSLSHIAELLAGRSTDLRKLLDVQRGALNEARQRTERALATLDAVQTKVVAGVEVSIDDLIKLAKESNMADATQDAIAWRRYEQARPRTEVQIDKAVYADYLGVYELGDDGIYYFVSAKDERLFVRVMGQVDIEVFPESETQFFMKVLPVQVTFLRDADDKVNNLIHHQGGAETKAVRTDPAVAAKAEAEMERRKREKIPQPDSEETLLRVIEQHMRGEPDYEAMSPLLAALARAQKEIVTGELKAVGPLQSLTFRGVGQSGTDVYDAKFEHADMEWGLFVGRNGKINTLYFRRLP